MKQAFVKSEATSTSLESHARHRARHWFFVGMSAVMLAIVLVGFAPTFYLREYFGTGLPPGQQGLPLYLHVHGAFLTLWFSLFLAQTILVASHRTNLHRRLGVAGATLAVAVVLVSLIVVLRAVPRSPSNGLPAAVLPALVILDLGFLLLFSSLVASSIYLRRHSEAHKRLMLLASISLIAPAISRLPGMAVHPIFQLLLLLSLLLAPILHDVISNGRVHRATIWGELWYVLVFVLSGSLAQTALARAFIQALR